MAELLKRPRLHVEGIDDQHSLVHLLIRNGIPYDPEAFDQSPPELPKLYALKGLEKLISGIDTTVKTSTNLTVGFLLDADSPMIDRWQRVAQRLRDVGVTNLPKDGPPPEGFIGESLTFKTRVGVWLMPDNVQDGKLEDFLRTLVRDGDPLIDHAEESTSVAQSRGAKFTDLDKIKAVIHAWLAWQKEPGLPYGLAMKATYFRHDTATATAFVQWFKELYRIA